MSALGVGIHPDVPEDRYHSDPTGPGLVSASASILKTLYKRSPGHAAQAHPKLRRPTRAPAKSKPPTDDQIKGTILHHLMLGTPAPHVVLDYEDYRTKAAQEAKAGIFAAGKIPILAGQMEYLKLVEADLRDRIARDFPVLYDAFNHPDTTRETTCIWWERGVLCRSRVDLMPPSQFGWIGDLKFTGLSAGPNEWSIRMEREYMFQSALYPRGICALRGDQPEFRFIVVEWDPPYGVSLHALGSTLLQIANRRLDAALDRWKRCLERDEWPGYPTLVHYAEASSRTLSEDDDLAERDLVLSELPF